MGMEQIPNSWITNAQKIQKEYGIPASVVLGQTIQETGWGQHTIGNYNIFGVKADDGWNGEVVYTDSPEQDEYGNETIHYSPFKDYPSLYDAFKDYAETLMQENYTQYTHGVTDPYTYLQGVKAGGYATDVKYVSNIWDGIIVPNNLTQYDDPNAKPPPEKITNNLKYPVKDGKSNSDASTSSSEVKSGSLTTAGTILRVLLIILMLGLGILFFVKAFSFDDLVKGGFKGGKTK